MHCICDHHAVYSSYLLYVHLAMSEKGRERESEKESVTWVLFVIWLLDSLLSPLLVLKYLK